MKGITETRNAKTRNNPAKKTYGKHRQPGGFYEREIIFCAIGDGIIEGDYIKPGRESVSALITCVRAVVGDVSTLFRSSMIKR